MFFGRLQRTKKVVGHYDGVKAKAWHWVNALNKAVAGQFSHGVRGQDLHLIADNGCQPTSLYFMKACRILGITQAFTSENDPKAMPTRSVSCAR